MGPIWSWLDLFPEPSQFNGEDMRPMESVPEEVQERDWHELESAAREFVDIYGAAAMLRCVSRALETK